MPNQEAVPCPLAPQCLLSSVPVSIGLLDHEGRFHGCNQTFEKLVGHTDSELEGQSWEVVVDAADRETLRHEIRIMERNHKQSCRLDLRLVNRWDKGIPCRITIHKIMANGYRHIMVVEPVAEGEAPSIPVGGWWSQAYIFIRDNWVIIAGICTVLFKGGLDYLAVKDAQAQQDRRLEKVEEALIRISQERNRRQGP